MAKQGALVATFLIVFLMVLTDIQLGISEPQDGLNKCCGVLSGFGSCTPEDPVENDQCEAACKEAHCSKGGRCTEPWGACECKC